MDVVCRLWDFYSCLPCIIQQALHGRMFMEGIQGYPSCLPKRLLFSSENNSIPLVPSSGVNFCLSTIMRPDFWPCEGCPCSPIPGGEIDNIMVAIWVGVSVILGYP